MKEILMRIFLLAAAIALIAPAPTLAQPAPGGQRPPGGGGGSAPPGGQQGQKPPAQKPAQKPPAQQRPQQPSAQKPPPQGGGKPGQAARPPAGNQGGNWKGKPIPKPPSHWGNRGQAEWERHVHACLNRYRSYNPRTDHYYSSSGVTRRCKL